NVVACLGEWDAFHPVHRIDLGITRIAMLRNPFPEPAAASIVARDSWFGRSSLAFIGALARSV
ncbi:MAG: hypothetical protein WAV38_24245, partial [Xanthobacteraceae bacterium]